MKRGVNLTLAVIAVYGITFCFIHYSKPVSNVRARRAMKSVGGKDDVTKRKNVKSISAVHPLNCLGTYRSSSAASSWNLAWSDEFDGNSLNTNNWSAEIGTGSGGWGNNELQYYTSRPQNLQVTGGNLVITAQKESYGG